MPGMHCLIQYIDGLNSHPVITNLLPWQSLVPEYKRTDVTLQQSSRSKIQGRDGNWHTTTDGEITQASDTSKIKSRNHEEIYHQRTCGIATHDTLKIDGNQINEVMGALRTVVGEKALIVALEGLLLGSKKQVDIEATENMNLTTLKTLHAKANELAKVEGKTVWLGDSSVNVVQVLLDLINVVSNMNQTLANHTHAGAGATPEKSDFNGYKTSADSLNNALSPIIG